MLKSVVCLHVKYQREFLLSRLFMFLGLSQCDGSFWQPSRGISGSISRLSLLQDRPSTPVQVRTHLTLPSRSRDSCSSQGLQACPILDALLYSDRSFPSLITIETTLQKIWEDFLKTKTKNFAFESHQFNLSYSLGQVCFHPCLTVPFSSAFLFPL